jgi:TolB protein
MAHASDDQSMPAWSPDGKQIAYVSYAVGVSEIFTMRADGSGAHALGASGGWPRWSPDGRQICFSRDHAIWVIDVAGGAARNFGSGDTCAWSNRGQSILFDRDDSVMREIFRVPAVGGDPTRLTTDAQTNGGPVESPDGARVAFNSSRDGRGFAIFVMNSDGSSPRRLTVRGVHDERPAWSPDGRWLAFESLRDGNTEIYKIPVP